jgi:2-keto-4-pentenoate hydratase/2-oxohepta-3-ene-1,7-dioic acid hydratase in catechol pathway
MRIANAAGRAVLLVGDPHDLSGHDIETASGGRFGSDLMGLYDRWSELVVWAAGAELSSPVSFARTDLGPPSPAPRQIVAIGLNYRDHALEAGFEVPDSLPPVFTKFVSSLTGPDGEVSLPPGGHTDWEVELVVVIGSVAHHVQEHKSWGCVAGLTVGQDLSERVSQMAGPAPQFSLGKSFPGFAPTGPWLVTPDEVPDRDDLELGARIDGDVMQRARTSALIFPVAPLIARLSQTMTLLPGDLIFTGTPAGVGMGREPQRYLAPGEHLVSWVEGIGEISQTFVAASASSAS